jgi:D-alanyl-lipoteichoic acid acyltransferase DltB (MBOAT superfamily)
VILATYAFAFQIYCDFSGYTDIARGCAKLMGFEFLLNFNLPYAARTPSDFWQRWHISLSTWLRDYLYIPLGGNKGGVRRTYRNLFLTMLLGGLWHGAAWTFVFWGALHGGYLVAERLVRAKWHAGRAPDAPAVLPSPVVHALQWFLTFHLVCLAWIFFRSDSLGTAFDVIGGIVASAQPNELATAFIFAIVVLSIASQFVPDHTVVVARNRFSLLAPGTQALVLVGALTVIDALGPDGVAPFIYFQF